MTLLVRDEADIVRQMIEFHLACGVDHIIATDNGSVDGTLDILRDYEAAGALTLIIEPDQDFRQHAWVTRMALIARDRCGADWILNADADEFWCAPGLDLKAGLPPTGPATTLRCRVRNMIAAHDAEETDPWWRRITARIAEPVRLPPSVDKFADPLPAPFFYLTFGPKVIVRAAGLTHVGQGNHVATHEGAAHCDDSDIAVYHYSVRSRAQFARTVGQASASYARNPTLGRFMGWHKKRWGRMIAEDGGIDRAIADALPDRERLARDLEAGILVRDHRPLHALEQLGVVPRCGLPS